MLTYNSFQRHTQETDSDGPQKEVKSKAHRIPQRVLGHVMLVEVPRNGCDKFFLKNIDFPAPTESIAIENVKPKDRYESDLKTNIHSLISTLYEKNMVNH